MVAALIKGMKENMPDTGTYTPVNEYYDIPLTPEANIVRRYGIRAYQMPHDIQPDTSISYLEDYALSTDGYKSSMIIKMGKKDVLLDFLSADNLVEKLQADFLRLDKLLTDE
jgi:hypothetical protein